MKKFDDFRQSFDQNFSQHYMDEWKHLIIVHVSLLFDSANPY